MAGCPHLDEYEAVMADLDGVVWLGGRPIEGNVGVLRRLASEGRLAIVTNNSTRSRRLYRLLLARAGLELPVERIVTSAWVAAFLLKRIKGEALVYPVGEEGLVEELAAAGHVPVTLSEAELAEAVVVGLDRALSYPKLDAALKALRRGSLFIATNLDHALPTGSGMAPGAGAIVEAISTASGRKPDYVAGKPSKWMGLAALEALGARDPGRVAVVGDRLDTDLELAKAIGAVSVIVATGVYKGPPPEGAIYAESLEALCRGDYVDGRRL